MKLILSLLVGTGNCWTAASNSDGAAVTLQKCGAPGNAAQQFIFTGGTSGAGQVKVYGNKCLDVKDGADNSGTRLQIWTCGNGNQNQQFSVSSDGTAKKAVHWAKDSNKCVDLTGGSQSGGTPVSKDVDAGPTQC